MECAHEVSYFFGGVFLANAVPHFVSGVMGKPFQSPFAKPPGEGLSSSTVNVLWGFANFVVAYLLIVRVGSFDLHATDHVIAVGVGVLLIGVFVRALVRAVSRRQFNHSLLSGMAKNSMARSTFRSLKVFNFRVWAAGSLVSNIGSWMQRTAQDWVVLTVLTHNNATAVGIIVALQFAPQVLLLPATGFAADHFDKPKLIFATQTAMGLLALGLGLLVVTGFVRLWQVDIFAFLLGCAAAFDMPARQAFISELVGEADLGNALALNSTLFNAARMIGPAAAGLLIAAVGTGAVFLINAASFLAVLAALVSLRRDALHSSDRAGRRPGGLIEGFRYVWQRADLKTILLMLLVVGMFGLNFPIFISTMAVSAFHAGGRPVWVSDLDDGAGFRRWRAIHGAAGQSEYAGSARWRAAFRFGMRTRSADADICRLWPDARHCRLCRPDLYDLDQ